MKIVAEKLALFGLLIVLISGLVLGGCAAEPKSAKVIELKYSSMLAPTHPLSQIYIQPMCDEIEKRTEGRVKFTIYWANALGQAKETYDIVKGGLGDMAYFPTSYIPGRFLLSEVGNLPYAAKNPANVSKALGTLMDEGYFDEEWAEVELLSFSSTSANDFLFRKGKPLKLEELAGLKVRSPGGYLSEYLKAINMVPVVVAYAESFTAFEKGLIDVMPRTPTSLLALKLHEIGGSLLDVDYSVFAALPTIFNKAKWASFPPDIQKVVREVAREYCPMFVLSYTDSDEPAIKEMIEAGIDYYSWPDSEMEKMRGAAAGVWERYIADTEAKGLPGRKFVAEFASLLRQLGEQPAYSP